MNIYLEAFGIFFKIGAFTIGGGYAMVPLIENEIVTKRNWGTCIASGCAAFACWLSMVKPRAASRLPDIGQWADRKSTRLNSSHRL